MSDEDVVITPYSPLWPALFDVERRNLLQLFNDAVAIEHIGATSIPGVGGKPVIDVMVGAPSLAVIDGRIPALEAEGWRYVPALEKGTPDRRYFTRLDRPPGKFTLHGVILGGPYWNRYLAFRDALRANPALAEKYWRVKQRVGARPRFDAAAYKVAKSDFITAVLERKD